MRKALAISFGLFVFAASPEIALACSCARNPTAEGILASATAVFTGTVRAVETIAPGQMVTTFVVAEPFKGAQRGQIVNVHHPSSASHSCGVSFDYGQSYTLAASLERGALWTSQCSTWMFLPHVGLSRDLIVRMRALRSRQ
jgi:hypothetical protein